MAKAARIRYTADGDYVDKQAKEFTLTPEIIEKLDSIEPSAERNAIQGIKVNGQIQTPDQYRVVSLAIPEVEDNLDSISSTNALSAKQGRVLYNRIKNLEGLGKFLSNWDSTTGMPTTNPTALPYDYHSGDYYIVARVGATNYRPDGTSYRGIPSTVVESEEVKVGDFYFFNGSIWELLLNTDRQIPIDESLSSTSTNPVENRVITNALNTKQNNITDLETIRSGAALGTTALQPGDNLSELSGTSDDINQGTTNLFMTTAERGKLANTTGVNTGDETNASIMSKLGAASATTNGYLTVSDWNKFNDKQAAISDLETIRSNAQAGKNASDEIATYGDIVTHNASEYAPVSVVEDVTDLQSDMATAQGDITSLQGDVTQAQTDIATNTGNISSLTTRVSTAETNITNLQGDVTSIQGDISTIQGEISDIGDDKQEKLIAGANIQIAADGKTISATDTIYTAGPGINISANNVISANDNKATWGSIEGALSDQADLKDALDAKQGTLTAGNNIQIAGSTISATDTKYTAGTGISISANNVISNTQTSAEWGNIQGDITDQTDLQDALDTKQNTLTAGANIQISGDTISATDTKYTASDFDIKDLADSTGKRASWDAKQNAISDLATIRSNASTAIQPNDNVSVLTNDAGYITSADIPTLDTAMSSTSTKGVQNKVIKSYVDTQVQEATAGAVSDTAYGSSWDGVTGIAPSKNAVYDKLNAMDTTIAGKQATISDLSTIRSGASKGATAVQPGDNISTLTNDSGFITKAVSDLTNYYTKSEVYTKAEVADYVANFSGFDVVATLPTTDIKTTIIYLLGPVGTGADKYEEYIYSNNTWIKIGETSIDLSPYFNKNSDTSDAITQGSSNLFLTSAERTKLSNTSGTNTGDETKSTIQSKLGAASSSASGYLTSTDWNTFNSKQAAISDLATIRSNATAGAGAATTIAGYGDVVTHDADEFLTTDKISDVAYASSWNGVTNVAPSKNAVYDKLSSMDTTISGKQDTISDLATIRSNASAGKSASDTIANYGDIVTHDASEFLTTDKISNTAYGTSWNGVTNVAPSKDAVYDKLASMDTTIAGKQATISDLATIRSGASAGATAVQPGDNVSTLNNDAGYITSASIPTDYVALTGAQTIDGTKTFTTSPVVPSKTTAAANTGTAIATEAQVYKKQDALVSGTNIKTINSTSLLGSGDISVQSALSNTSKSEIQTGTATTQRTVTAAILASALPTLSADANNLSKIKIWAGTQAQYDALTTKDSNTLYFTTE